MSDEHGRESDEGLSRRMLLTGGLAVAASVVASAVVPQVAVADVGSVVHVGDTAYGHETSLESTANGLAGGNAISSAVFNRGSNFLPDYAVQGVEGIVWPGAPADSTGVVGYAYVPGHTGVYAVNNDATGFGLKVYGRTSFLRSGMGSVSKNQTTKTVTVTSGVNSGSKILVTLQGDGGSGVYLKYAALASATTFKVVLTKKAAKTVRFSWMVTD
jgi:hypothetical protein